jgi:hypothetical protein
MFHYTTFASNLLARASPSDPFALNSVGATYRDWVTAPEQALYENPVVDRVDYPIVHSPTPSATISATLSTSIRNNGNTETTMPYVVAFYADKPLTQEIGSVMVPIGLGGCARRGYETPPIVWSDLGTGLHYYWVTINGSTAATGFVLVNPETIHLPLIYR